MKPTLKRLSARAPSDMSRRLFSQGGPATASPLPSRPRAIRPFCSFASVSGGNALLREPLRRYATAGPASAVLSSCEPTSNLEFQRKSHDTEQWTGFMKPEDEAGGSKPFQPDGTGRLPCETGAVPAPPDDWKTKPSSDRRLSSSASGSSNSSKASSSTTAATASAAAAASSSCASHPRRHVKPEDEVPDSPEEILKARSATNPHLGMSKDEMWARMREANRAKAEDRATATIKPTDVDYLKIETDMQEEDKFHWRIGQMAIDDHQTRMDYYTMYQLAACLNKARWKTLEVYNEKGTGTMGVGMRSMFWKESLGGIINTGKMPTGQFVDGHPILRPFADIFQRRKLTKTFLRGFVDSRLKVVNQPGNMKQLLDMYDKGYGFFYASLLEVLGVQDEHAEHIVTHIGRAVALTQHCVLLWRKYAKYNITMLPSELCADNQVNLSLLRNLHLASEDKCVRRCLYEVMCQVKAEMEHVRELMPLCPPAAWPLLLEAMFPNYYLGFLMKYNFDVRKFYTEEQIYSAGFLWYSWKKTQRWNQAHSLEDLVAEAAPIPYTFSLLGRRATTYNTSKTAACSLDPVNPRGTSQ